ncbi:hypothetical protein [Mycolicibacterium mucogenicum]|uniref:Uncharacterized protein n=1 Tax=Mycolicibacterium mucogenicum DSM 44124 TaxID=1226753 RepID=A0A8E4W4Q0_MYCMU|nr:hypothetical protein [Mycolicibacterium mucogenicum]QPG71512.1 hypothetical protein C1S78_011595 [Mycolicibacterium mucogenicum DSM 44124]
MTAMRARAVIVAAVLAATVITGCQRPPAPGPQAGALTGAPILNTVTAQAVVRDMGAAGLPVANPRDVATQKCPDIKCIEAIETDTVTVLVFSTTGAAEGYAGATPGTFQAMNIVLKFGPTVSVTDKTAYEQVVNKALL